MKKWVPIATYKSVNLLHNP